MLEIDKFDLDEIAMALSDQSVYDEHLHLVNPETGEMVFWTRDGGIDGETPVDLDALDLVAIRPLPSYVWYQDMADFTDRISDERAARRLARARWPRSVPPVQDRAARGVPAPASGLVRLP